MQLDLSSFSQYFILNSSSILSLNVKITFVVFILSINTQFGSILSKFIPFLIITFLLFISSLLLSQFDKYLTS